VYVADWLERDEVPIYFLPGMIEVGDMYDDGEKVAREIAGDLLLDVIAPGDGEM